MGLKHNKNLLIWKNLAGLQELMKRCIAMSDEERIRIAKSGRRHIMKHYSYAKFVERMLKRIQ